MCLTLGQIIWADVGDNLKTDDEKGDADKKENYKKDAHDGWLGGVSMW